MHHTIYIYVCIANGESTHLLLLLPCWRFQYLIGAVRPIVVVITLSSYYACTYIGMYAYLFLRERISVCTYINQLRPQRTQFFWMLAKFICFFHFSFIIILQQFSFFLVAYFGMELHFLLSKTNGGNTKIKWNKSSCCCCVPRAQQKKVVSKRTEVDLIDISTVIIHTILIDSTIHI